jgi:small nuclear ribonucleoprotein (snRNP)-like protein
MKIKDIIFIKNKITLISKKTKESIILVELKNGMTCNGILKGIDDYLNILLHKAIITMPDGKLFIEVLLVFIKGNKIRLLRFL